MSEQIDPDVLRAFEQTVQAQRQLRAAIERRIPGFASASHRADIQRLAQGTAHLSVGASVCLGPAGPRIEVLPR